MIKYAVYISGSYRSVVQGNTYKHEMCSAHEKKPHYLERVDRTTHPPGS